MSDARLDEARALHRGGEAARALAIYRELRAEQPGRAEHWYLSSLAEQELGQAAAARASVDRALALEPDQPHFRLHSGRLAQDAGDMARAEGDLRRVAELRPAWALVWNDLGAVLLEAKRTPEALACFERATSLDASRARSWNNVGLALLDLDRLDEAAAALGKALAVDPAYALAHLNLARLHEAAGNDPLALAHALEACRLAPRNLEAHLRAGDIYRKRSDAPRAIAAYRSAVAVNPGDAAARNALADMLRDAGQVDEARREFETNLRGHPANLKAALGSALLLPLVYASGDHLSRSRERYRQGLEALSGRAGDFAWKSESEALSAIRWTNFYLAYQGGNDRELQSRYGDFIRRVLEPAAPRLLEPRPRRARAGSRLRVGFASFFFFNCTAGRYFASWIRGLDASRFEAFVYYTNPWVADDTRAIAASAAHFRHLPQRPVHAVAKQILEDDLDILVYPELGMHADTFALGSLRLAPVQCAGWGHPTTTGLPAIDWFLSCGSMEPEGAQAAYRERLALLPGLGTAYARPTGASAGERRDFGLPAGRRLYLVPQSLFKIHPDNDELIAEVLARDPEGLVVLFEANQPGLAEAFATRIAPALAARGLSTERHLLFLPYMTHGQYLRVNALCDVMLDTLHWSGGNTSLDAIAMGLPIVTLPGELMRGRQSLGMLRALGLEELVARDADDYARIATGLAGDPARRRDVAARMAARAGELFDQQAPLIALAEFLESAATA